MASNVEKPDSAGEKADFDPERLAGAEAGWKTATEEEKGGIKQKQWEKFSPVEKIEWWESFVEEKYTYVCFFLGQCLFGQKFWQMGLQFAQINPEPKYEGDNYDEERTAIKKERMKKREADGKGA